MHHRRACEREDTLPHLSRHTLTKEESDEECVLWLCKASHPRPAAVWGDRATAPGWQRAGSHAEPSLCFSGVLLSFDLVPSVVLLTQTFTLLGRSNESLGFGFHSRFSKANPVLRLSNHSPMSSSSTFSYVFNSYI